MTKQASKLISDTATPAMLLARERARSHRLTRQEKGLCPKHGAPVARLKHCHQCCREDLARAAPDVAQHVPQPGDQLRSCFRCEHCDRHYHKGSIYNYQRPESPRKKRGIQPGPNNSLFNYDKRHPDDYNKVSSLCGECRKEGGGEWRYHNHVTWKGRCSKHRGLGRLETKRWRSDTGAIVLPKKRSAERGVRKRPVKVAFICANRKKTIHGRHLGVTYLSQTKSDEWQGLCTQCQSLVDDPKKIVEDFPIGNVMVLRFSQASKDGVPIEYKVCGHDGSRAPAPLAARHTALVYRRDCINGEPEPRGVCAECVENPAAMPKWMQATESNGQKNTNAKTRSVGRPRSTDAKQTLDAIQITVLSLKADGHPRRYATSNRVASLLGNVSPTGGDAMMKKVKTGVRIEWPALRDLIWDGASVESLELIRAN